MFRMPLPPSLDVTNTKNYDEPSYLEYSVFDHCFLLNPQKALAISIYL